MPVWLVRPFQHLYKTHFLLRVCTTDMLLSTLTLKQELSQSTRDDQEINNKLAKAEKVFLDTINFVDDAQANTSILVEVKTEICELLEELLGQVFFFFYVLRLTGEKAGQLFKGQNLVHCGVLKERNGSESTLRCYLFTDVFLLVSSTFRNRNFRSYED